MYGSITNVIATKTTLGFYIICGHFRTIKGEKCFISYVHSVFCSVLYDIDIKKGNPARLGARLAVDHDTD